MKVRIIGAEKQSWYHNKIGETFEVERRVDYNGHYKLLKEPMNTIWRGHCEIIEEPKEIPIKPLHNVQNPNRPNISQEVINGFTAIVDAQDGKGLEKYGRSIDDANDADYSWPIMALEEMADYSKYLVREIKRLEAENQRYKALMEKVIQAAKELEGMSG